ncbi:MAG: dTDP-4-dehydrorhamnose reductase [Oleispira antarctica]|nr:dTDP-4-dehydrorhamnose reductase [Oleispira antarctica]
MSKNTQNTQGNESMSEALQKRTRILVTAKNGQLGWELARSQPENVEAQFFDSKELNICNSDNIAEKIARFKPDLVINAAAYTAVDKAESDSDAAFLVNQQGAKNLAQACKDAGAKLIHISTDFVFDATKNTPYQPSDSTNPLGVYGASKLAGEEAALEILGDNVSIIRTAWVYSLHGNNFVKTMLRLMAEKEQLGVVADQVGTPTNANNLAKAIWLLAEKMLTQKTTAESISNIYHWTDLGTASWYDFAVAIQELGLANGLLNKAIPIAPIKASQYPTPAKRPSYSVLDTSYLRETLSVPGTHWCAALNSMLSDLKKIELNAENSK